MFGIHFGKSRDTDNEKKIAKKRKSELRGAKNKTSEFYREEYKKKKAKSAKKRISKMF